MQIIDTHPLSSNSLLGFWRFVGFVFGCFFFFSPPSAEILNAVGNHRQVNLTVLKILKLILGSFCFASLTSICKSSYPFGLGNNSVD